MLRNFVSGLCAGVCIALGGSVYLACENKVVGALFFSVALLCICMKGYFLFTGKVGYLAESCSKQDVAALFVGLFGNLAATLLCGLVLRAAMPHLGEAAHTLWELKLTQRGLQTLVRSFFCGILMYLAVSIYREKKSALGILFCVPVFILSGFEHSIANLFYFGAAGVFRPESALFLILVLIGNALGGLLLPLLSKIGEDKHEQA